MAEIPASPQAIASSPRSGGTPLVPWLAALVVLHLALVLPVISSTGAGNDYDETHYHYPGVLLIRQHWPRLDLVNDCLSPIAPGYHYFLATCSMITGPSLLAMRLVTALLSLFIPVLLFVWLSRYVPVRAAFVYTLPVALSCFFLKASCRVVTDNPSLLLTLLSLMGIFLLPAQGMPGIWVGVTTAFGVMTRQLGVSLVGPSFLQIVLEKYGIGESRGHAWRVFAPALAFRLLPILVLGYLVYAWHGLVAPQWRTVSFTLSAAPLAYILAVAGFLGTFFVLSLGREVPMQKWRDPWVVTAGIFGLAASLISPTTWSSDHGRWGGWIWALVHHMPALEQRSFVFIAASPWGAALLALMARIMWWKGCRKEALLWSVSVMAWASSYAVGTNIYHHYFEAPLMVFFAVACAIVLSGKLPSRVTLWPIALLLAYDLALSLTEIYGGVFFHLSISDLKQ